MKTRVIKCLALTALLLSAAGIVKAQDVEYTYVQAWVKIIAVGKGTVSATSLDSGTPIYRAERDFKSQLPVMMETAALFYGYSKPEDGSQFVGWYEDDGDGVFDITKDEPISDEKGKCILAVSADRFGQQYASAAEAKKAAAPTEPQAVIFGVFTDGAIAAVEHYQEEHGAVDMSKYPNSVGDEVTIEAFPEDGFEFAYWRTAATPGEGEIVSSDNPFTFTVKGGDAYYAVFRDLQAPTFEFPEEGGWKVMNFGRNQNWVLDERSDAVVYVFAPWDVQRQEGRTWLDPGIVDAQFDVVQTEDRATLMYGKGTVRCTFRMSYGFSRGEYLVKWSGAGVTFKDTGHTSNYYAYVFDEAAQAFVQFANSDFQYRDDAQEVIAIPANTAYFVVLAENFTDDEGNIPEYIAFSPEGFDKVATGIDEARTVRQTTLAGQRIYTLGGQPRRKADRPGIYVIDGKKVAVK